MKEKRFRVVWAVSLGVLGILGVIQSVNSILIETNDSGFLPDILVRVIGVCQLAAVAVLVFAVIRRGTDDKDDKGA